MDFKIIKNPENPNRKKLNKIIIFLIIGAIAFLAFGSLGGKEEAKKPEEKRDFDLGNYKAELENEAEQALSKISGAGDVKVILSFDSMGKTVVARNNQSKSEKDSGDPSNRESKEVTDSVVVYGQGQSEQPYVTEEKIPIPTGALVIAKGADDETVRFELYEAIKALYGISSHRIKVTVSKT